MLGVVVVVVVVVVVDVVFASEHFVLAVADVAVPAVPAVGVVESETVGDLLPVVAFLARVDPVKPVVDVV